MREIARRAHGLRTIRNSRLRRLKKGAYLWLLQIAIPYLRTRGDEEPLTLTAPGRKREFVVCKLAKDRIHDSQNSLTPLYGRCARGTDRPNIHRNNVGESSLDIPHCGMCLAKIPSREQNECDT